MPAIYLIDDRISQAHLLLQSLPKSDIGLIITSYMAVSEIVTAVLDKLTEAPAPVLKNPRARHQGASAPAPLITALRILAHGDSELIHLGWGIHERNVVQLSPLASHMLAGSGGECLLLGCNVAMTIPRAEDFLGGAATSQRFGSPLHGWTAEELGVRQTSAYRLLFRFARTLGVPTTASLDTQSLPFDGHFLGRTFTVDPDGKVSFTGADTPATL